MSDTKGGGFDPEQMKRQFGDIWKQTMEQLEDLRDVVVKASQTARTRLDATFLRRERDRLYQQLGEDTFVLIETGKLKAPPALRDLLDRIHAIGQQLDEAERQEEEEESPIEPAREPAAKNGKKAAEGVPKAAKAPRKKPATRKKTASKKKTGTKKKATRKTE
ncbi:MAG: hypothetical protein ACOCVR_00980 [Myxococcota bacterium]